MPLSFQLSASDDTSIRAPTAPRRVHWLFYAIILFGSIVRIHEVWIHNPMNHLFSDAAGFWDHAKEPTAPSPMAVMSPPFFQMWVSVLQKYTLGIPELVAIYAAILSVLTPWVWYRFLREAVASRTLALAGWALLAVLPSWIGIYSYIMAETLFLPLVGLSLWMTVRASRKQTVQSFVAMVAVWMVAGLTRPIAIPSAAAGALLVWLKHPHKFRAAVISFLMVGGVLAPLAYRNYHFFYVTDPWGVGWWNKIYVESGRREILLHFTKNGGAEGSWLYGYGSPSIASHPFAPLSDWSSKREGSVNVYVEFTHGVSDWKTAYEATAVHGAQRWQLRLENLIFLFFGTSWPDDNPDYFIHRLSNLLRWIWAPFFVLLVVLYAWRWRDVLARPLLPVVIAVWFFVQGCVLLVPNEGRYRKPLEGLFIVQAITLVDQIIARRRKSSMGPVASAELVVTPTITSAEGANPGVV